MSGPIQARDVTPETVQWLWRERIPRRAMTVVAGRPDQGKGLFCAHVAAEVSRAGGKVLYSAIEDSNALITRPRLEAAGANLDRVLLWRFMLPMQMDELESIVLAEEIDLIIIDPVAAHLSHGVSRHSDSIRTVLNPLTELCEVTNAAVLFVDHALKRVRSDGHFLDTIGGSGSGLPAACRMAFVFGSDPNDEEARYLCPAKSNLREKPASVRFEVDVTDVFKLDSVPTLVLTDDDAVFDGMRLFDKGSRSGKIGRPPDKRAAAAEWLTTYLKEAGKPVPAGKVFEDAKHYGMTNKTLRRAAGDMGIVHNPPGGGRNCTWDLPTEIKELLDSGGEPDENDANAPDAPKAADDEPTLSDDDLQQLLGGALEGGAE